MQNFQKSISSKFGMIKSIIFAMCMLILSFTGFGLMANFNAQRVEAASYPYTTTSKQKGGDHTITLYNNGGTGSVSTLYTRGTYKIQQEINKFDDAGGETQGEEYVSNESIIEINAGIYSNSSRTTKITSTAGIKIPTKTDCKFLGYYTRRVYDSVGTGTYYNYGLPSQTQIIDENGKLAIDFSDTMYNDSYAIVFGNYDVELEARWEYTGDISGLVDFTLYAKNETLSTTAKLSSSNYKLSYSDTDATALRTYLNKLANDYSYAETDGGICYPAAATISLSYKSSNQFTLKIESTNSSIGSVTATLTLSSVAGLDTTVSPLAMTIQYGDKVNSKTQETTAKNSDKVTSSSVHIGLLNGEVNKLLHFDITMKLAENKINISAPGFGLSSDSAWILWQVGTLDTGIKYYKSNSSSQIDYSNELTDSNFDIEKFEKTGYKFCGIYTEQNMKGEEIIDANGRLRNTYFFTETDNPTLKTTFFIYAYYTLNITKITISAPDTLSDNTVFYQKGENYYWPDSNGEYSSSSKQITYLYDNGIDFEREENELYAGVYTQEGGEGQLVFNIDMSPVSPIVNFSEDTTVYVYFIKTDSYTTTEKDTQVQFHNINFRFILSDNTEFYIPNVTIYMYAKEPDNYATDSFYNSNTFNSSLDSWTTTTQGGSVYEFAIVFPSGLKVTIDKIEYTYNFNAYQYNTKGNMSGTINSSNLSANPCVFWDMDFYCTVSNTYTINYVVEDDAKGQYHFGTNDDFVSQTLSYTHKYATKINVDANGTRISSTNWPIISVKQDSNGNDYIFKGYKLSNGLTYDKGCADTYFYLTDNITITALFEKDVISLDKCGGTGGTETLYYNNGSYYLDEDYTKDLINNSIEIPTRTGYKFDGYCYAVDSNGNATGNRVINAQGKQCDEARNSTLYAKWVQKTTVYIPTINNTYTYDGTQQTAVLYGFDSSLMTVSNNVQTNAGTYSIKISLIDTDNYAWADGTAGADVYIDWVINKLEVKSPTRNGSLKYNGEYQQMYFEYYDDTIMYISDEGDSNIQKEVGKYTTVIRFLTDNYTFDNGNGASVGITWSISKGTQTGTVTANDLTYDGIAQELVAVADIKGTIYFSLTTTLTNSTYTTGLTTIPTGIDAGTYTVYYFIDGGDNYSNKSNASVTVTISPKTLTPIWSPNGETPKLIYNGVHQSPKLSVSGMVSDEIINFTITYKNSSGTTVAQTINSGTYTVIYTISTVTGGQANASNYCFDGGLTEISNSYEIVTSVSTITLNKNGGAEGTDKLYIKEVTSGSGEYGVYLDEECQNRLVYKNSYESTNPITIPKRVGYIFGGFFTVDPTDLTIRHYIIDFKGNLTNKYYDNNLLKSLQGGEIYAAWLYPVAINYNGGIGDDLSLDTMYVCDFYNANYELYYDIENNVNSSIYLPVLTKDNYTFKGYYDANDNQLFIASGRPSMTRITNQEILANLIGSEIKAKFQAKKYTITLDNQSATEVGSTKIYFLYDNGIFIDSTCNNQMSSSQNPITLPTKEGYVFNGYYGEYNGNTICYINALGYLNTDLIDSNYEFITEAITFTAKWLQPIGFEPTANTLTYNGQQQIGVDDNEVYASITNNTAINAGKYTATITLKEGYCWQDNTTGEKAVSWSIAKKVLTPSWTPSGDDIEYEYTGSHQAPTLTVTGNVDGETINFTITYKKSTGTTVTQSIDAGTYTVTYTISSVTGGNAEASNYSFDEDVTSVSKTYSITKYIFSYLQQKGTLQYNAKTQSVEWIGYYSDAMTISGTTSAINAGTYTATFTLKDTNNYAWENSTSATREVEWEIQKNTLIVFVENCTMVQGSSLPDFNNLKLKYTSFEGDDDESVIKGTKKFGIYTEWNIFGTQTEVTDTSNLAVGKYLIIVGGLSADNYSIIPNASYEENYGVLTVVDVKTVNVPAQSGKLTYNGLNQSPVWNSDYDSSIMIIRGTVGATNAAEYNVTFTLESGYKWADGTDTAKSVTWKIDKARLFISLSNHSIKYGESLPEFRTYYTGFVNGEDESVLNGTYRLKFTERNSTTEITDTSNLPVGTYWVHPEGYSSYNYAIEYAFGTLTITGNQLAVPTNIKVSTTGQITWDNITNAVKYQVKVDDGEWKDEIIGADYSSTLTATAGAHTIYVKAIGDGTNYFDSESGSVTINVYSVTITKADAGIKSVTGEGNYIEKTTITISATLNDGYKFASWSGDISSTTNNQSVLVNANKTINANSNAIEYSISYDLDGGSVTGNPTTYTVESEDITLLNPTKQGYTFMGWSGTDLTGNNNTVVTIAKGSIGNRSYVAHYTQDIVKLTSPTISGTYTYNGASQQVKLDGFDASLMTISGNIQTDANETGYDVVIALKDKTNYSWSDGSTDDITLKWVINRFDIANAVVSLSQNSFDYTGTEIAVPTVSVKIQNFVVNSGDYTLVNNNNQTNAGTYTITVNGTNNLKGTKQVAWTINKVDASLEVSSNTETIIYGEQSQVTITTNSDGEISVNSNRNDIASAVVNGKTITITATGVGSTTIVVTVSEGTNHNEKTVNITVSVSKKTLTITGVTAQDRIANGQTNVSLSGGNLVGIVGSDDVTFTLGQGQVENASTGKDKLVTTNISLTGSKANNYTLTQPTDVKVKIYRPAITFNTNGAVSQSTEVTLYPEYGTKLFYTLEVGGEVTSFPTNLSKDGFNFIGYYTNSVGGTQMVNGSYELINTFTGTQNETWYAQFGAGVYAITLQAQDATNTYTQTIYLKYDEGFYTESECTNQITTTQNQIVVPTKQGYTFDGYYTMENGVGTKVIGANGLLVSDSLTSIANQNITLYANFVINKYSLVVTLTTNATESVSVQAQLEADSTYSSQEQTILVGDNKTITLTIENIPYNTNGTLKLKWTSNGANVYYIISNNGHTSVIDNIGTAMNSFVDIQSYAQQDSNGSANAFITQLYKMEYNANGGSAENLPQAEYKPYNATYTISTIYPSYDNYNCLGYGLSSDAVSPVTSYSQNQDQVFYAVWSKDLVVKFYNFDSTTPVVRTYPVTAGDTTNTFTTTVPEIVAENGYIIVGYTKNKQSTQVDLTSGEQNALVTNGDVYYAVCKKVLNLTYNANGKTLINSLPSAKTVNRFAIATEAGSIYQTDSVTISATVPQVKGYAFQGWNTNADGSGSNYQPSSTVTEISDDTTLYAIWQLETYTITYKDSTGIIDGLTPDSYNIESTDVLPNYEKTGFTFNYWVAEEDSGDWSTLGQYNAGTVLTGKTGNVVLVASVNATNLVFNGEVMPNATYNKSYSYKFGQVTGGTGNYTYEIVNNSLPTGLELNASTQTISGVVTARADTYTISIRAKDTLSNATVVANFTLTIEKAKVIIPSLIGTYTYNGNEQTANIQNFDVNTMSITNNTRKNAGTQTIIVSLRDNLNYTWSDGSTANRQFEFEIKQKQLTISARNQVIKYEESIDTTLSSVSVVGLVANDKLQSISILPSTTEITNAGEITLRNAKIFNGTEDVTDNYQITYLKGNLIITKESSSMLVWVVIGVGGAIMLASLVMLFISLHNRRKAKKRLQRIIDSTKLPTDDNANDKQ